MFEGPTGGLRAVLGPTNTGKTHFAIERMLAHPTGMIGLPLRLLAREVYNRIAARIGEDKVALVTGEERLVPARPRYWVATVEAMPLDMPVDCLAIDEIQTATDFDRGHVFTDRILSARGRSETLLLGAATMVPIVRKLLPDAEIIHRPRLSTLTWAGSKKITRQPARTAIVAFSAAEVYAIAELVRRERGGAAVVMGALSPRTRNAQVELFENGDVDFLIATDAIGMGLNLDVRHVAFASETKFDGYQTRPLTPAEFGQIAGRAGRHTTDGTFGSTGIGRCFRSRADRPNRGPRLRTGQTAAMAQPHARFLIAQGAARHARQGAGPSGPDSGADGGRPAHARSAGAKRIGRSRRQSRNGCG